MKKIIGIIGGMGPAATVDLFSLIVQNTSASCDQEHIHILIDCNPEIPDRTASILQGTPSPLGELINSALRLSEAGADFLIIPCNTSHFFIKDIRSNVSIPVVDMIEETAKVVRSEGYKKAIILCTEGTRKTGVYTQRFRAQGIETVYPDQQLQKEINAIIYDGVKSGAEHWDVSIFNRLLDNMEKNTKAVSVLGCTELPIAMNKYGITGHFVNPTEVLAKTAIQLAGYSVK